jgi:hypothetical protein
MVGTRFGRGYYGATDSISCSTKFQTAPEAVGASGTAWQDHPVSEPRNEEVCLGTGANTGLAGFAQSVDALMQELHFTEERVYGR